jgi:hypothetical protein
MIALKSLFLPLAVLLPYSKTGIDPFWGVGPRPKIPTKKHIIESDSLKALRARFNLDFAGYVDNLINLTLLVLLR